MGIAAEKQEIEGDDVVKIHHIVLVKLLRGIDHIYLVADLIVPFYKLPKRKARL